MNEIALMVYCRRVALIMMIGKCLIGAITNYTLQLVCSDQVSNPTGRRNVRYRHSHRPGRFGTDDTSGGVYNETSRSIALKFLDHFIGDMTQPLHVCGRDRGGNTDHVRFDGNDGTNLHAIWDSNILDKRIRVSFPSGWQSYADHLVDQIKSGEYEIESWMSDNSIFDLNALGHSNAAIEWANDTDGLDCSVVWPDFDANPNQDFGGAYFLKVGSVIDLQLAKGTHFVICNLLIFQKGGYRLGNWLNAIFATCL